MKQFLKKQWSNILFVLFIILLIIPQTRVPIQVGINRLMSFSPSTVSETKRDELKEYTWQLRDIDGNRFNLEEARGEVVLINLWATWCPPCIAEMPSFQELYDQYGEKVTFLFVSNEEAPTINSFLEKHQYDLPIYQPLSIEPERLQSRSLPTTYLLSRSGEIVVEKKGVADWNASSFHRVLDELIQEEPL